MKMIKALIIFAAMFFLGCVSFLYLTKLPAIPEDSQTQKTTLFKERRSVSSTFRIENNQELTDEDWEEEVKNYKIKLLTAGQFHGDEVSARSGEKWLGLFKENDKYFLRSTIIKVRRVRDDIVDGDSKRKTGKLVSVANKNEPIFLIKNANQLREGQIQTVFDAKEIEQESVKDGFIETHKLGDKTYTLKVVNENPSEYLNKGSKLILSFDGKEQVLFSIDKYFDDGGVALYWIGDLDRDGKLDLFLDAHWHYNVEHRRLFLSSQAENGDLVKEVAAFQIVGC